MRNILIVIAGLLTWVVPQPFSDLVSEVNHEGCPCEFVAPIYPPIARLSRTQGTVSIKASLDPNGHPVDIEVVQDTTVHSPSTDILERAAISAMRKWRFCSSLGSSSEKTVVLNFKFKLLEDATIRQSDQWYPTDVSFQPPGVVEITTTVATIRTD
jgi:TonB family protein